MLTSGRASVVWSGTCRSMKLKHLPTALGSKEYSLQSTSFLHWVVELAGGGKHCLFGFVSLSVSQFSQSFFFGISGIKCVQDKIFGIFYVQIHENLQICTKFSEISLSKNQKKVIFARNR